VAALEFMQPLVNDMVHEYPARRPNMDEVVTRFSETRNKVSIWKLRSRMSRNADFQHGDLACQVLVPAWSSVAHWYRTAGYILARKAAIPEPK
jgi:hypothetical protein